MRCEVFETEDASSLKFGDQHIVTDIEVWGDSLGQNSALAKANAAYLSLIPRWVLLIMGPVQIFNTKQVAINK